MSPPTGHGNCRIRPRQHGRADARRANRSAQGSGAARIYRETASGAKAERRELGRALKSMTAGDTLLVTRLDRLARSTRDLLNILDAVAKGGAGFRSLADIWADTTTPHGRLMLTVLGGLAEFERDLIRLEPEKVGLARRRVGFIWGDRQSLPFIKSARP